MQNSSYFLATYIVSFFVAVAFVYFYRGKKKKAKIRAVLRLLFTSKIWLNPSSVLDYKYTVAAILIFPAIISYTVLSMTWISFSVNNSLKNYFGAYQNAAQSKTIYVIVSAATLFIAHEFAYWLNHYMSHKVKFLWEFHKIHHSAKVLTPFTTWRKHCFDSIIFSNIAAVIEGVPLGVVSYIFGMQTGLAAMTGFYMLNYVLSSMYGILQHSQIWISFTGVAGRIFLSPAHHQIHHSNNPIHFDKNFGATLSVFDWLFGTLYIPAKCREKIVYGVGDDGHLQTFIASTIYPIGFSWKHIATIWPKTEGLATSEPITENDK